MCHCYFMEHSVSKENNQGPKKNRIPGAALKRDRNTKSPGYKVRIPGFHLKKRKRNENAPFYTWADCRLQCHYGRFIIFSNFSLSEKYNSKKVVKKKIFLKKTNQNLAPTLISTGHVVTQ